MIFHFESGKLYTQIIPAEKWQLSAVAKRDVGTIKTVEHIFDIATRLKNEGIGPNTSRYDQEILYLTGKTSIEKAVFNYFFDGYQIKDDDCPGDHLRGELMRFGVQYHGNGPRATVIDDYLLAEYIKQNNLPMGTAVAITRHFNLGEVKDKLGLKSLSSAIMGFNF